MDIALPLEQMSVEDKIRTMELIWDDLCKKADSIPSPSWNKTALDEREKRNKSGGDELLDWDAAKKHIRNTIS